MKNHCSSKNLAKMSLESNKICFLTNKSLKTLLNPWGSKEKIFEEEKILSHHPSIEHLLNQFKINVFLLFID